MTNDNFFIYLIMGLISLLFIKDEVMPYIKHGLSKMFGVLPGNSVADDLPATRAQMDKLSNYYNHDTTALLQNIDKSINDLHDSVRGVNTNVAQININLNKLETAVKALEDNHREWEKYGIPAVIKK